MFPKIKKTLKSFILDEKGTISKQSVLKIGSALALSAFAASSHVEAQCGITGSCAGTSCGCSCGCEDDGGGGSCGSCACGCACNGGCD